MWYKPTNLNQTLKGHFKRCSPLQYKFEFNCSIILQSIRQHFNGLFCAGFTHTHTPTHPQTWLTHTTHTNTYTPHTPTPHTPTHMTYTHHTYEYIYTPTHPHTHTPTDMTYTHHTYEYVTPPHTHTRPRHDMDTHTHTDMRHIHTYPHLLYCQQSIMAVGIVN